MAVKPMVVATLNPGATPIPEVTPLNPRTGWDEAV